MARIRLTEWAAQHGISYQTALRWWKDDKLSVQVERTPTGRLLVLVEPEVGTGVVLYGRVSSADQKSDLFRQMERLRTFAAARGLSVTKEVAEIGSGLNGHRKGLLRVLRDKDAGILIVEHKDRLARFGVEYLEALLVSQGRTLLVANAGEQQLDLVQDFVDVVTSMCARIYGRRSAKNRAKAALAAAQRPDATSPMEFIEA